MCDLEDVGVSSIENDTRVFIIKDKTNDRRGGGRRCRCYERRRGKSGGN